MLFWRCPLISDFSSWFSLVQIAAGPSLCLLNIISGICLTSHALLGESHCPLTYGCELFLSSQEASRCICGYMYVVQAVPRSDTEVPENFPFPLWQPPCPNPLSLSSLYAWYKVWHVLWEMHKARHGLWILLLCSDKYSLLPSPFLCCWAECW